MNFHSFIQNVVLINNSRTTSPIKILNAIFEFLIQFSSGCLYCFLKKNVDNFETEHKTCSILVGGAVPPSVISRNN